MWYIYRQWDRFGHPHDVFCFQASSDAAAEKYACDYGFCGNKPFSVRRAGQKQSF